MTVVPNVKHVMKLLVEEGGEFWKKSTEEEFESAAGLLISRGFGIEEAADLLGGLRGAVADEYGA